MGFFFSTKSNSNHPLSDREFKEVLSFFRNIADDLCVVDEDWEDGMKEYTYDFRNRHERVIGNDRYVFPYNNIYVSKDNSGKYHSCGKIFSNLKDAQINSMMRWFVFYDQYCDYIIMEEGMRSPAKQLRLLCLCNHQERTSERNLFAEFSVNNYGYLSSRFKFMKHLFVFVLLLFSYSFTGLAQVKSATKPRCSTNCDLLEVVYFYSNEISSMLRLSFIGPYSSGSYHLNKEIVLYAYDGCNNRKIGAYHAKNCYFLDNNGHVNNMSFNQSYTYQPGKNYCDILIEFEPIPLYTTSISIQEPPDNTSAIPWHWDNIAIFPFKDSSHSGSSLSSSSGGSSGTTYSNNNNSSSIGLGVLLGLAAVAIDALTDNDASSSSSSSSSSSCYSTKKYSSEDVARLLSSGNLYACRFEDGSNMTRINAVTRAKIIIRGGDQYMEIPERLGGTYKLLHGYSHTLKGGVYYMNEGGDNWYLMDQSKNIILY